MTHAFDKEITAVLVVDPHHRHRPGDYETWTYMAPIQQADWKSKSFEYGARGGEIHPRTATRSRW